MRERLRRAQRMLRDRGCNKTILYLWRPQFEPALNLINYDLACYHIDDEYNFSKQEIPIDRREAQLLSRVDQVFIHSATLFEKKGKLNPCTTLVPNGVDYQSFATLCTEPGDLQAVPHPRIGYVGFIKSQLDIPLLIELASKHPYWSFVMVGPRGPLGKQGPLLEQFRRLRNVYFLGPKPVNQLPAYVQNLDVCMLCYEVNDYTKFIYPLKLHEYLASGRPVVSSAIPAVNDFSAVVRIARTVDEWSRAIEDCLAPASNGAPQIEARRSVAHQYDWDRLVTEIVQALCRRLGSSYLDRFKENFLSLGSGNN